MTTEEGKIIKGFESIRGISKSKKEIDKLKFKDKIEIILNKFYNY